MKGMDQFIAAIIRVAAGIAAIGVGVVSWKLNVIGFAFVQMTPDAQSIGQILAYAIIVMQLIFNNQLTSKEKNITIIFLGIFSYFYGIGTNVLGLVSYQGLTVAAINENPWQNGAYLVVDILFGMFIEMFPEVVFIYALKGISSTSGNLLGALGKALNDSGHANTQSVPGSKYVPSTPKRDNSSSNNLPYTWEQIKKEMEK